MVFSPLFGFLGDRYVRKYLMAFGITFWAGITFAGSFIQSDVSEHILVTDFFVSMVFNPFPHNDAPGKQAF